MKICWIVFEQYGTKSELSLLRKPWWKGGIMALALSSTPLICNFKEFWVTDHTIGKYWFSVTGSCIKLGQNCIFHWIFLIQLIISPRNFACGTDSLFMIPLCDSVGRAVDAKLYGMKKDYGCNWIKLQKYQFEFLGFLAQHDLYLCILYKYASYITLTHSLTHSLSLSPSLSLYLCILYKTKLLLQLLLQCKCVIGMLNSFQAETRHSQPLSSVLKNSEFRELTTFVLLRENTGSVWNELMAKETHVYAFLHEQV